MQIPTSWGGCFVHEQLNYLIQFIYRKIKPEFKILEK